MKNPRSAFRRRGRRLIYLLAGGLVILSTRCDFQSPADFKLPTWFVDLAFPLVQKRYPLGNMVDNKQIFATADSTGMQLIFEGSLPDTSIDPAFLQVEVNQDIQYSQDPVLSPSLTILVDTTINIPVPIAPGGVLVNTAGSQFSVPSDQDQNILASAWNTIAAAFDTTIEITISLPQIESSDLPFDFSVDAILIQDDSGTDSSLFSSSIQNNGLPTAIEDIQFRLLSDHRTPADTLASHTRAALAKDSTFTEQTLIGGDSLGTAIQMTIAFGLDQTNAAILTINQGDSVQVNLALRLRIAGVDEAVVQIAETALPVELPPVDFPSDIEVYNGQFETGTGFGVNQIKVSNLKSTFPFAVDFYLNFRNFIPPAGQDSVKIDTTLENTQPALAQTFDVDGYNFANPNSDSALTAMVVDLSAVLAAQRTALPLDGSEIGHLSIRIQVEELRFESLEANIIQEFPPTSFVLEGMPQGFSGMAFTDVRMEIEMLNQIQLPVVLDFGLVGYGQLGDSSVVSARATLGSPSNAQDTAKTVIRLSNQGTTTLLYDSPSAPTWTDSSTVPPGAGQSTIVDLLSFNPASMVVNSASRIDGRGEIVAGAMIGGNYRMISPFEVRLDPMTFISVTNTPIAEMDHATRNRIRSSLLRAELQTTVINSIPVGGEISILLSNNTLFPLDTTQQMLSIFRDTMVVQRGWDPGDSLYVVRDCETLNLDSGQVYIFDVLNDYSDCEDGLVYLVKSSGSLPDTLISYVDTLVRIVLPDPAALYADTSTVGVPGAVAEPGVILTSSVVDTGRIKRITDPGDHYTAPRFHLNGSQGAKVYLSLSDYIDIRSTIIFRLSSTGVIEEAPNELVVLYPNGGETLIRNQAAVLRWKTYGRISQVDLHYSSGSDPDLTEEDDWTAIGTEISNVDSFSWTPTFTGDSLRVRVSDSNSAVSDMSGWYFSVTSGSGGKILAGSNTGRKVVREGKQGSRRLRGSR